MNEQIVHDEVRLLRCRDCTHFDPSGSTTDRHGSCHYAAPQPMLGVQYEQQVYAEWPVVHGDVDWCRRFYPVVPYGWHWLRLPWARWKALRPGTPPREAPDPDWGVEGKVREEPEPPRSVHNPEMGCSRKRVEEERR